VIRLGLRLTLAGGREAAVRLAVTSAAVAIGVALLVITLAGINAVDAQNDRYAWLETGVAPDSLATDPPAGDAPPVDPVWWRLVADHFDGEVIGRVDVAATGPDSPVPPGIPAMPGPGELYASPALVDLLRATPDELLDDRYPGTLVGVIGAEALPAPDTLLVVVGHDVDELASDPDATLVSRISTTSPRDCGGCISQLGIDADGITLVLSVVAAALLFPVLVFIASATRLSAARREQRFAAMRLVGATPRQIAVIATVESSVAAVVGVAAGLAAFWALRSPIAAIPFTGAPFFTSDLSLHTADIVLVAAGVPLASAVAARVALRRVQISPLGVSRRSTPRPPRAWRLIPLVAGVAELAWFAWAGRPATSGGQTLAYLTGILAIMAGLVIAGPWITMAGARLMARRTSRPAVLIAGRRLADDPKAGFRAISGLVLALFVGSCAIGVITTILAYDGAPEPGATDGGTVIEDFREWPDASSISSVPGSTLAELAAIPGVEGVALIHASDDPTDDGFGSGLVDCAQLATTPSLGRCPDGAETASIDLRYGGSFIDRTTMIDTVWPASPTTAAELADLPVSRLAVGTDGSTSAIEQARTTLERAFPEFGAPETLGEMRSSGSRLVDQYRQLANVVVVASLPIAGCSLAVSVAGGLTDRKRPFSLLRLAGAPLALLRRVVALESVAPLLLTAAVAAGSGFLAAQLFLRAQLEETLQPPHLSYYLFVLVGLGASLAVIASTLPLLERITGPETARNE
jgi:hypothetical protein